MPFQLDQWQILGKRNLYQTFGRKKLIYKIVSEKDKLESNQV